MSSMKPVRIPKYRHHKGGQAFVQVVGRFYLGKHGSEASQEKYRRFVAELTSSCVPTTVTPVAPGVWGLQIIELCAAYWKFAERYYVKGGNPTGPLFPTLQGRR